ncbi:hypothetical protein [Sphingobium ummariense]|uniref:Uncharacterized protein n=1 Tax=Sphingobium ummariense RL-3 TaxID=1346791 RepID=T0K8U7_9SPHN|nr:hypothetical protein [Sphingobium ummariense]EQB29833.1 hypothetical protein M529_22665 [Sphingobium ummariense RL-3]
MSVGSTGHPIAGAALVDHNAQPWKPDVTDSSYARQRPVLHLRRSKADTPVVREEDDGVLAGDPHGTNSREAVQRPHRRKKLMA